MHTIDWTSYHKVKQCTTNFFCDVKKGNSSAFSPKNNKNKNKTSVPDSKPDKAITTEDKSTNVLVFYARIRHWCNEFHCFLFTTVWNATMTTDTA